MADDFVTTQIKNLAGLLSKTYQRGVLAERKRCLELLEKIEIWLPAPHYDAEQVRIAIEGTKSAVRSAIGSMVPEAKPNYPTDTEMDEWIEIGRKARQQWYAENEFSYSKPFSEGKAPPCPQDTQ